MSLTVDELAKEIGRIYEGDDAWCRMVATGLLPFIERHIAAGQPPPTAELAAEYCRGRDDGWEAAEQKYRQPPKPAGNAIDGLLATARPFLAEELLLKQGYTWSGSGWVAPVPKPAGAVPTMGVDMASGPDQHVEAEVKDGKIVSMTVRDGTAGAVPMPEPVLRAQPPFYDGRDQFYTAAQLQAYGDAREAAGRAVAVPLVDASFEAFNDITGLCSNLREGGPAPEDLEGLSSGLESAIGIAANMLAKISDARSAPIPQQPAADDDHVLVERGLLGAACSAIEKKRDAPKVLEALRKITMTPAAEGDVFEAYKTWPDDIRKKLSAHDLRRMGGWAPKTAVGDWRIDTSAGGPILVYQNCSVIEGETARYVLRLIECDLAEGAGMEAVGTVRALALGGGAISIDWHGEQPKPGTKLYDHPTPAADAGGVTLAMIRRGVDAWYASTFTGGGGLHLRIAEVLTAAITPEVRHGE